jgi:hypothetical protein
MHQPVRRDINEIFSDDVNFQNDYRSAHEEDMVIDVITAHHVPQPIPVQKYVSRLIRPNKFLTYIYSFSI